MQLISVGIDVSKGKSTVCVLKPGGEVLKAPFEITHTRDGVLLLVRLIHSYPEEARVVLEDTGHYHWSVVEQLIEHGIFVCTVNALRMKKYCAQSIRKAKTDKIDALRIASYGLTYWSELVPVKLAEDTYKELKLLARQYYRTVSMLTKAKVNLNTLLDQVMPGIVNLLRDRPNNHKLTEFVVHYWHYGHIVELGEKQFTADYCKWAKKQGYRLCERLAKEIFTIAQNGIPVLPNSPVTKIVVTEAVRVLHQIEMTRDTILAQMQTLAKTLPEFSVAKSFACVGDTLAPRLIAEIGDVRRFKNKHSLIAYAGIDAPPFQSGAFNATERHISKRGNRYLRKTGFEIMQSLLMHRPADDPIFGFIRNKCDEGKSGKEAMIAGLNKFLRVYYGKVSELYKTIQQQQITDSSI